MKRSLTIAAVGCATFLAVSAFANGTLEIGTAMPGTPASLPNDLTKLTDLINLYNAHPTDGSTDTKPTGPGGSDVVYTIHPGSGVPTPPPNLPLPTSGIGPNPLAGGLSLTITLTTTLYDYLTVKWGDDLEAYYIKGLTGTITVNNDIFIVNKGGQIVQNGASGYELFDPTTVTVPDGGTTLLLLGSALSGLGLIRRKLS